MASKTLYDIPGAHQARSFVPSVLAATATQAHPIFVAPCKCIVTRVSITPQASVTGDNSNRKNLNVLNTGSAGSGTTEIANLDLATATDLTAFDEKVISAALTTELAEGDVLSLQYEKVGNGVLVPNVAVAVDFKANPSGV